MLFTCKRRDKEEEVRDDSLHEWTFCNTAPANSGRYHIVRSGRTKDLHASVAVVGSITSYAVSTAAEDRRVNRVGYIAAPVPVLQSRISLE